MSGRSWQNISRESDRRESGVKRFAWGIHHVKHHMDEREIVADYLAGK